MTKIEKLTGKIYLIYDERARVIDLDFCTLLLACDTEKEAIREAKKVNGVIVESIHDNENKIITETIIN